MNPNRKNLANGLLALGVSTSDTTWVLESGYGGSMPAVPFFLTTTPFGQLSTMGNSEIVNVTARTDDTLTVQRAQKGTTAKAFPAGSIVSNGVYAEDIGIYLASQAQSTESIFTAKSVPANPSGKSLLYTNSNVCTVYAGYRYTVHINAAGLINNPAGGFGVYFRIIYPGGADTISAGGSYVTGTPTYQSWSGVVDYSFTPTSTGVLKFEYLFGNDSGANTTFRCLSGERSYEYNYHSVVGYKLPGITP